MQQEWINWSGSLRFTPLKIKTPSTESEIVDVVCRALKEERILRVVGAGHSSSALVETDNVLVSLEKLKGLKSYNTDTYEATLLAGTPLEEAGEMLHEVGLAMPNLGDVSTQTIAGALSTGTHGSGKKLQNLAAQIIGGSIVTGRGELKEFSIENDPHFVRAARAGLGTLGVFTALKLKLIPTYQLRRQEWCMFTEDCLAQLEQFCEENRNFDFYWYPRRDDVKVRLLNFEGQGSQNIPRAKKVEDKVGWSHKIIPKHTHMVNKFEEMEYALPADVGLECFREIRQRIIEKHRKIVGWRVLYRVVAPDDGYLSTASGRQSVTISIHQNAGLPYWDFFQDIEPIFRSYDGRPHWGKKHTRKAMDLRPLYPKWEDFQDVRQESDPNGVFLSPYLQELLGVN